MLQPDDHIPVTRVELRPRRKHNEKKGGINHGQQRPPYGLLYFTLFS